MISAKVNLSPKKYLCLPRSTYLFSNLPKWNLNFSIRVFNTSVLFASSSTRKAYQISTVKSSKANDCEPINPDYIVYKAAAICRKLYVTKSKNIGDGSLRSMFSKKQRRGCQPPKTFRAGGKIIRELVIQLKTAGYIQNYGGEEETNSGLHLTKTGRSELDKIASGLMKH